MSDFPLMRGELPFPEAGEGIVLRFTNPDCEFLQKKFGDNWMADALARLSRHDMEFIRVCFERGCKKDGKYANLKFEDADVPLAALENPILDALFIATVGRTFEQHIAYMEQKNAITKIEKAGAEDPNP